MMAAAVVVVIAALLQCGVINVSVSSFAAIAFTPHVTNNHANAKNNVNTVIIVSRRHRHTPLLVDLPSSSSLFTSGAARSMTSSSSASLTSSTQLSMVAKSGGRLILTAEQFEREVLHLSPSSSSSASSHSSQQQQQQQQHSTLSSSSINDNVVSAVGLHMDGAGDHSNNSSNNSSNNNNNILPVLVLFTAPWCGPCRLTSPVVTEIMTQYANKIHVLEISTDDLPDVAISAGVRSIPTILLYHEGVVQDIIVGCVAKNVLAHAVDKMLEELHKMKSRKH